MAQTLGISDANKNQVQIVFAFGYASTKKTPRPTAKEGLEIYFTSEL